MEKKSFENSFSLMARDGFKGLVPMGTLKVAVKDTGIGVLRKDVPHLFEPFTLLDDSSTRKFGGMGLGLCFSMEVELKKKN